MRAPGQDETEASPTEITSDTVALDLPSPTTPQLRPYRDSLQYIAKNMGIFVISRCFNSFGFALALRHQYHDIAFLRAASHYNLINMLAFTREFNGPTVVELTSQFVNFANNVNDVASHDAIALGAQAAIIIAVATGMMAWGLGQTYGAFILPYIESDRAVVELIQWYPTMGIVNWSSINLMFALGMIAYAAGDKMPISATFAIAGTSVVVMSHLMTAFGAQALPSIITSNFIQTVIYASVILGYWQRHRLQNAPQLTHSSLILNAIFNRHLVNRQAILQARKVMHSGVQRVAVLFMQILPLLVVPLLVRHSPEAPIYLIMLPFYVALSTVVGGIEQSMSSLLREVHQQLNGSPLLQSAAMLRYSQQAAMIAVLPAMLTTCSGFSPFMVDYMAGNAIAGQLKVTLSQYVRTITLLTPSLTINAIMRANILSLRDVKAHADLNTWSTRISTGSGLLSLIIGIVAYLRTGHVLSFSLALLSFSILSCMLQTKLAYNNLKQVESPNPETNPSTRPSIYSSVKTLFTRCLPSKRSVMPEPEIALEDGALGQATMGLRK